ncbi:uncharacterized protein WM277_017263 isoform 1-T1 [Molossus nigricans]
MELHGKYLGVELLSHMLKFSLVRFKTEDSTESYRTWTSYLQNCGIIGSLDQWLPHLNSYEQSGITPSGRTTLINQITKEQGTGVHFAVLKGLFSYYLIKVM